MKLFSFFLVPILLLTSPDILTAQAAAPAKASFPIPDTPSEYYDFWLGEWEASWDEGDGIKPHGLNTITKELDSTILVEKFRVTSGGTKGFQGMSISVYNPKNKRWHQAWADNQGTYYNFEGVAEGDRMIFRTLPREIGDKTVIQRMVFHEITATDFTWDWESSTDGGTTWNRQWQIFYTRKGKP